MAKATFAAGCFWGVEAAFRKVKGVLSTAVGYSGGHLANATYKDVCSGKTGHAEVVQVRFDPKRIAYRELLELFFSIHDPTTLNRQGADAGTQYRSVIFYHDDEQKRVAEQLIRELESAKTFHKPIVTQIAPFHGFYPAEEYHQEYFKRNPYQGYCQVIIAPKMAKFRQHHAQALKQPAH